MALGFTGFLVNLIVGIIIVAPILWLVGRSMVGGEKAKFTDALWITILGIVLGTLVGRFAQGWLGFVVSLLLWLFLIKHFFDAGWGRALLIAIVAVIVLIVIVVLLALIGFIVFPGLLRGVPLTT